MWSCGSDVSPRNKIRTARWIDNSHVGAKDESTTLDWLRTVMVINFDG